MSRALNTKGERARRRVYVSWVAGKRRTLLGVGGGAAKEMLITAQLSRISLIYRLGRDAAL